MNLQVLSSLRPYRAKVLQWALNVGIALSICAGVMAQPLPPFLEELNLTRQQQEQIKQLIEREHEETKPLLKQLQESHQQTRADIEATLTQEQLTQLKKKQSEMAAMGPLMRPF